jgi:hypothetical protein
MKGWKKFLWASSMILIYIIFFTILIGWLIAGCGAILY